MTFFIDDSFTQETASSTAGLFAIKFSPSPVKHLSVHRLAMVEKVCFDIIVIIFDPICHSSARTKFILFSFVFLCICLSHVSPSFVGSVCLWVWLHASGSTPHLQPIIASNFKGLLLSLYSSSDHSLHSGGCSWPLFYSE